MCRHSSGIVKLCMALGVTLHCVSEKCTNFDTVLLKIIKIDFDEIWQKYSKYPRIEIARFSFRVGLLFCELFIFQTGKQK